MRASKMGQAVTLEELTAKEVAQTGTIGQGGAALDYRKTQDHERMVERLAKATGQYVPGVVKELGE
ncbi:MAG: hypothetical protein GWN58_42780, partial [Anaerolineae bacterium]|nr:hypothetical protein [Anaerolineae bacterium]